MSTLNRGMYSGGMMNSKLQLKAVTLLSKNIELLDKGQILKHFAQDALKPKEYTVITRSTLGISFLTLILTHLPCGGKFRF